MKRNTIQSLVSYLNGETVTNLDEIKAEANLPDGFTKGRVQYGLTHNWADRVVKIEGKPNTYRLA